MAIGDDFTIDYVNKRIYHSTSATTVWTVNALYSYLQDTFDELDQMDDPIPMSAQTPTEYSLINGWFMNEAREGSPQYRNCFEYLKTGAVKTDGQNAIVQIVSLVSAGYVNAVASDIGKMVTDDAANTGNLLDYDNTNRKWWVRWGTTIAASSAMAITTGTGAGTSVASASTTGEHLWPNIYTLGTIEQHTNEEQIYIEQNLSRVFSGTEWWPESKTTATTRHVDVLIKTKEAGSEIDSGNITVYLRNYPDAGNADLYDHFGIDLTAGGRNAVPLATSPDLNNTAAATSVATYSGITVAFVNGTLTYSATNGTFTEFETVTQVTTNATGIFLRQTSGTGSGTLTLANVVGTFNATNTISGASKYVVSSSVLTNAYRMVKQFEQQATSPEYSVIVGCNSFTLAGVYQYLKYTTRIGSTFTMYPTGYPQGGPVSRTTKQGQLYIRAHEDTQTTPTNTFSPVKASPFGTFAGGKFFGAQGVWIQNMATGDIQNFQLIDSDGTTQTPPNKQPVTVTNLISGDRVSVFRTVSATDSSLNKAMYTAAAANTSGNTSFIVTETIAVDTPSAGSIRTVDTSDTTATRETRYTYTSWATSTFSGLSPALDRTYTLTDDKAYVPFIDFNATQTSASVTVIYSTDRSIIVRVRRKAATAILPFETTGTFTSSGYSTSAIRTTDTIVT